jgi:glutamate synthase domain-containing protein 1
MCRLAAIKAKTPVSPVFLLQMMQAMQKGHDNSGFAMTMQDLGGVFANFKKYPLLSMACTSKGLERADGIMESLGFEVKFDWKPDVNWSPALNFQRMPHYVFRNYRYPEKYANSFFEDLKFLLTETTLKLRSALFEDGNEEGYVYSFWPDVLTLKEIGDPTDIGKFFGLWEKDHPFQASIVSAQCRQNTNYRIVRYAAHPFFLEGYTVMVNGENTFYQKNRDFQKALHPAYIGFESDSQCFLYTLHYVVEQLKWPLQYYKHVITPLPFDEMSRRPDASALMRIRQACMHLEINGPNAVIFVLPQGHMGVVNDAKKLRPTVIGKHNDMVVIASEVCGIDMVIPGRNLKEDVYPRERETVIINNGLEIEKWQQ